MVLCRQKDDGNPDSPFVAQDFRHPETVDAGHHDIEKDECRKVFRFRSVVVAHPLAEFEHGLLGRGRLKGFITCCLKVAGKDFAKVVFVVYNEYTFHRLVRWGDDLKGCYRTNMRLFTAKIRCFSGSTTNSGITFL